MGVKLDPQSLLKQGSPVVLGDLDKIPSVWTVGLGWKPGVTRKVDCDLWLVALKDGVAVELVRYDPKNPKAKVVSPSGALEYLGDDRTGESSDEGDDEQGLVHVDLLLKNGDQVLLIANIYEPEGLTFDQVEEAYIRVFPGTDESKAQAIQLTQIGKGARCVIFGWLQVLGMSLQVEKSPSHAPDIQTALAPFGVG
jgi:stress response protein SCP2